MAEQMDPFEALVDLEQQSKQSAAGLPSQVEITANWSGIRFVLAGKRYVAPMGEVSEILPVPRFTSIPGVHSWVKGVANVRGKLLPILDLCGFFGEHITTSRKRRRILVVEYEDLFTGVVVDEVLGMQHFPVDTFAEEAGDVLNVTRPYLQGSYHKEDETKLWSIFSLYALARDPSFIQVEM